MSGWTDELHKLGGAASAGVYGGINTTDDFSAADAVYISRADKRVTVWGLNHDSSSSTLDDSKWASYQRIHQYNIDVNETWGGVTLHIDPDLVDTSLSSDPIAQIKIPSSTTATILTYSGTGNYTSLTGIANGLNSGSVMHMGNAVGFEGELYTFTVPGYTGQGCCFFNPISYSTYRSNEGLSLMEASGYTNTYPLGTNNIHQVVGTLYNFNTNPPGLETVQAGFLYSPKTGYQIIQYQGMPTELEAIMTLDGLLGRTLMQIMSVTVFAL